MSSSSSLRKCYTRTFKFDQTRRDHLVRIDSSRSEITGWNFGRVMGYREICLLLIQCLKAKSGLKTLPVP
jgi:hypothetical protein